MVHITSRSSSGKRRQFFDDQTSPELMFRIGASELATSIVSRRLTSTLARHFPAGNLTYGAALGRTEDLVNSMAQG